MVNPRGQATLAAVATAVGVTQMQAIAWLDPNNHDLHQPDRAIYPCDLEWQY